MATSVLTNTSPLEFITLFIIGKSPWFAFSLILALRPFTLALSLFVMPEKNSK